MIRKESLEWVVIYIYIIKYKLEYKATFSNFTDFTLHNIPTHTEKKDRESACKCFSLDV